MRWFFAPAKVNLWLHVLGRRGDGYHELDSLVAFARVGDRVGFQPGVALSLTVAGPQAAALGGEADNLMLRAARNLAARVDGLGLGAFTLVKNLPLASGLGGGSSDAAAALRALCAHNRLKLDDPRVREAALATGSDVLVCLTPSARMMRGRGEDVGEALAIPPLLAVLVNPGVAAPTPAVFAALGYAKGFSRAAQATAAGDFAARLAAARNDLETSAIAVTPVIGEALAAMRTLPGAALVRMSGSGATAFALFGHPHAARSAAARLRRAQPGWWVRATRLG